MQFNNTGIKNRLRKNGSNIIFYTSLIFDTEITYGKFISSVTNTKGELSVLMEMMAMEFMYILI